MIGDRMSGINVEARKELRKLINRLLRNKTVNVTVSNKLDRTFLSGEAAIVSYGQKIIIETFENPPKLVSKDKKAKKKI